MGDATTASNWALDNRPGFIRRILAAAAAAFSDQYSELVMPAVNRAVLTELNADSPTISKIAKERADSSRGEIEKIAEQVLANARTAIEHQLVVGKSVMERRALDQINAIKDEAAKYLAQERGTIVASAQSAFKDIEHKLDGALAIGVEEAKRKVNEQVIEGLAGRVEELAAPILAGVSARVKKEVTDQIQSGLGERLEPTLREIVSECLTRLEQDRKCALRIEVLDKATGASRVLDRQHYLFPILLRLLCLRDPHGKSLNLALHGPAGNGKTSLALNCARALDRDFVLQPFNPQTSKSDLLGYMAAGGNYVASPFYDAFKNGKLYVADEFDACNPAVAVLLNAAIANRVVTFPNLETVKAHRDFQPVFIMNTMGTGADHQYTGRNRLDAASLDRLVYLEIPIDQGLEAAIAEVEVESPTEIVEKGGRFSGNEEIVKLVQNVRAVIGELNMKYIISPRATIHAITLHAGGFGKDWIIECCISRGMSKTDRDLIKEKLKGRL